MDVSLESTGDMYKWRVMFQILTLKECMPLWSLIGIPQPFIDNPEPISEISEPMFNHDDDLDLAPSNLSEEEELEFLLSDEPFVTEEESVNFLEATRMIYLSQIYKSLAKVLFYYGNDCASEICEWVDRHYFMKKTTHWDYWDTVFTRLYLYPQDSVLYEKIDYSILNIIDTNMAIQTKEQKELDQKLEVFYERFTHQEVREKFKELYEIERDEDQFFSEEIENIFSFNLLFGEESAYKIWKSINKNVPFEERKTFFSLLANADEFKGPQFPEIDLDLENYCLSV